MTTIVAFSDCHYAPISPRLAEIAAEADNVFFLGDGAPNLSLQPISAHQGYRAVGGNCDPAGSPSEEVLAIEGRRILLTHGHRYGVKTDLTRLWLRARELNCDTVFFGHTHRAEIVSREGITLINPGALSLYAPAYVYAVIDGEKLNAFSVPLR